MAFLGYGAYHEHEKFCVASHTRRGIDQRSLNVYYGINAHEMVRTPLRP
jgi:hypothetical protein